MSFSSGQDGLPAFLISQFPVLLPEQPALTVYKDVFAKFVQDNLGALSVRVSETPDPDIAAVEQYMSGLTHDSSSDDAAAAAADNAAQQDATEKPQRSFLSGLMGFGHEEPTNLENKMLTDNGDLTNVSTKNLLVDLFFGLENVQYSWRGVDENLTACWKEDPLATLKIIFNARSIHLGKGSKSTFYRAIGWLANEHPVTFLNNLHWLVRPIIEKKAVKEETEDDIVFIEPEKPDDDPTRFDVKNGVAHGYWKDLLNILALSANDRLHLRHDPEQILNDHPPEKLYRREWNADKSKRKRDATKEARHDNVVELLATSPLHQCLHIGVARLFGEQLKIDLKLLYSPDMKTRRRISLCGKWAPSQKGFHDKHTFVVSSIAEILHPHTEFPDVRDREVYLRYAREAYRRDVSALRKALEVVERDVSSGKFASIKYDHVPSLAMFNYSNLFLKKDEKRFIQYIEQVAAGTKRISGATLLPSTLVKTVREEWSQQTRQPVYGHIARRPKHGPAKALIDQKLIEARYKVSNSQWNTLVQRIRDSGSLQNCIAVCDVSGSMYQAMLPDGSLPVDSAVGLSLLVAEVTKAPFGGKFITFSKSPIVANVDLKGTFSEKVQQILRTPSGYNTNIVSVFSDLILPMARENKLTQEEMVKRIFVFSDMQFDQAGCGDRWTTSFERIQAEYRLYGYEMPELVFWNLAARAGRSGITPKPVTHDDVGTALISGYSQAMLKVFLDDGVFEADEEEVVVNEEEEDDDDGLVVEKKKRKLDQLEVVKKAIGHKAYEMLEVVD